MASLRSFLHSQLFVRLPEPTADLTGKTVIVTGSNVGLGLEAAKSMIRLHAGSVILAVRSEDKGVTAKRIIEAATKCGSDVVQVWPLDLSSYASVKAFAKRAEALPRLDVLLENAGMSTKQYRTAEDNEITITTNVVSTTLLACLLLPKLRETARTYNTTPHLTVVTSDVHFWTKFEERNAPAGQIFKTLNDQKTAKMKERYQVSKLLEVYAVRQLADMEKDNNVIVNCVNPGLCHSTLTREAGFIVEIFKALLARKTSVGARTLVGAATAGHDSHGQYMSDCKVAQTAPTVSGPEGPDNQKKVWSELSQKLEQIQPGILQTL